MRTAQKATPPVIHCEFCGKAPVWRFRRDSLLSNWHGTRYERFACNNHLVHVRLLVQLDWKGGVSLKDFEPYRSVEARQ